MPRKKRRVLRSQNPTGGLWDGFKLTQLACTSPNMKQAEYSKIHYIPPSHDVLRDHHRPLGPPPQGLAIHFKEKITTDLDKVLYSLRHSRKIHSGGDNSGDGDMMGSGQGASESRQSTANPSKTVGRRGRRIVAMVSTVEDDSDPETPRQELIRELKKLKHEDMSLRSRYYTPTRPMKEKYCKQYWIKRQQVAGMTIRRYWREYVRRQDHATVIQYTVRRFLVACRVHKRWLATQAFNRVLQRNAKAHLLAWHALMHRRMLLRDRLQRSNVSELHRRFLRWVDYRKFYKERAHTAVQLGAVVAKRRVWLRVRQNTVRVIHVRQQWTRMADDWTRARFAVLQIQKLFRGRMGRRRVLGIRLRRKKAAVRIQALFRGHTGRVLRRALSIETETAAVERGGAHAAALFSAYSSAKEGRAALKQLAMALRAVHKKRRQDVGKERAGVSAMEAEVAAVRESFDAFDVDGSGQLDTAELASFFTSLDLTLSPEQLAQVAKVVDSDRSGHISFEEFIAWFKNASGESGSTSGEASADATFLKEAQTRFGTRLVRRLRNALLHQDVLEEADRISQAQVIFRAAELGRDAMALQRPSRYRCRRCLRLSATVQGLGQHQLGCDEHEPEAAGWQAAYEVVDPFMKENKMEIMEAMADARVF